MPRPKNVVPKGSKGPKTSKRAARRAKGSTAPPAKKSGTPKGITEYKPHRFRKGTAARMAFKRYQKSCMASKGTPFLFTRSSINRLVRAHVADIPVLLKRSGAKGMRFKASAVERAREIAEGFFNMVCESMHNLRGSGLVKRHVLSPEEANVAVSSVMHGRGARGMSEFQQYASEYLKGEYINGRFIHQDVLDDVALIVEVRRFLKETSFTSEDEKRRASRLASAARRLARSHPYLSDDIIDHVAHHSNPDKPRIRLANDGFVHT